MRKHRRQAADGRPGDAHLQVQVTEGVAMDRMFRPLAGAVPLPAGRGHSVQLLLERAVLPLEVVRGTGHDVLHKL